MVDGGHHVARVAAGALRIAPHHHLVAPGVPGGGHDADAGNHLGLALVQLHPVRDRIEVVPQVGARHRAAVGERVAPLLALDVDLRLREHQLGRAVRREAREATGVVEVQVRDHHVIDRGRVDADLRERMLDGPDAAVGGALELVDGLFLGRPLAAGAGLHQRAPHAAAATLARALDQHAVHREADAVVGVRRHPARPHGARNQAEHAATVQAEASCSKDLPGGRCESIGHVRLLSS